MKKYTTKMKLYQIFALISDILYVLIALFTLYNAFKVISVPEDITSEVNVYHNFLFFGVTTPTLNLIISLIVGYLLVFLPLVFVNFKKVFDKDKINIDAWDYRTQYLYGIMAFFTFNPISFILRFIAGNYMQEEVKNYNIFYGIKLLFKNFIGLFKKETWIRFKEKRIERKKLYEEQPDLEILSRNDFFKRVVKLVFTYTFLAVFALIIIIPFYWMVLTALKTNAEVSDLANPRLFIGLREMQWVNFKTALTKFDFAIYLKNTIIVGFFSTIGTLVTTILAAFAFSRLEFKGREFIFAVLLMTMMIPGELYTITNFVTVSSFKWINKFEALVIPFMTSVFYIFFLRQSFKQIPDSLYKAAKVDGAGDFKYLARVMIPIASPTIITIAILNFIGSWSAYIWPNLVTTSKEMWLISVALRGTSFTSGEGSDARPLHNLQLAATSIVTIPLLIIFFMLKKYIIRGVGRSGTKG